VSLREKQKNARKVLKSKRQPSGTMSMIWMIPMTTPSLKLVPRSPSSPKPSGNLASPRN